MMNSSIFAFPRVCASRISALFSSGTNALLEMQSSLDESNGFTNVSLIVAWTASTSTISFMMREGFSQGDSTFLDGSQDIPASKTEDQLCMVGLAPICSLRLGFLISQLFCSTLY